jgi:lysozyme
MYKDVKGLPTIGVGHLITSKEPQLLTATLTKGQIKRILDKDLDRFEKVVKDTIRVPLKQNQKDALIHFAFNIGENGFRSSSLAKLINSKASDQDIIRAFSQWRTPAQLEERRAKEARLFLTGNYSPYLSASDFNKYFNPSGLSDCFPERNVKIVRLAGHSYLVAA